MNSSSHSHMKTSQGKDGEQGIQSVSSKVESIKTKNRTLSFNQQFIQKQYKSIKTHLLESSRDRSQVPSLSSPSSPTRTDQLSTKRHIDVQRERLQIESVVEQLYNRILLLEKENKSALRNKQGMDNRVSQIFTSRQTRQQQHSIEQFQVNQIESQRQQRCIRNIKFKMELQNSCDRSKINSSLAIQSKAYQMKILSAEKKQEHTTKSQIILEQNAAQFSATQQFEKQSKFNRLLNFEVNKYKALKAHNQRVKQESLIVKDKQFEIEDLKQKEESLLQKLAQRQEQLQNAVFDLQAAILMTPQPSINNLENASISNNISPSIQYPGFQQQSIEELASQEFQKLLKPYFQDSARPQNEKMNKFRRYPNNSSTSNLPTRRNMSSNNLSEQTSKLNPQILSSFSSVVSLNGDPITAKEELVLPNHIISAKSEEEEEGIVAIRRYSNLQRLKSAISPSVQTSKQNEEIKSDILSPNLSPHRMVKVQTPNRIEIKFPSQPEKQNAVKLAHSSTQSFLSQKSATTRVQSASARNISIVCPPSNFLLSSVFTSN